MAKPRPTGRDEPEYKNWKSWSWKRWAWEFLRRSPEFQTACRNAGDDAVRQGEVAAQFHLKKFKNYREPFTGSGRPKFDVSDVSTWSNLDERRYHRIGLGTGQVLVRFDLNPSTEVEDSIAAQLRSAEAVLRKRLAAYRQQLGVNPRSTFGTKPMHLLDRLRLLDLLDGTTKQPVRPGQAHRILHEKGGLRMSDAEAKDKYRKHEKVARELAAHGYRFFAARNGKPALD